MNKCQQCGEPAQTTLCKTCAKHMRRQIASLAKTIPELRALAERKARAVVAFVVVSLGCR